MSLVLFLISAACLIAGGLAFGMEWESLSIIFFVLGALVAVSAIARMLMIPER